ncbi:MAG: PPC domain-containing protein [Planctomycetota bacterium]
MHPSPEPRSFGIRLVEVLLSVLALAVCISRARAEPTIDRIEPGGAPPAAELEILLTGKEFADPEELWFEARAIEVVSLTAVDATHAKATIRVPVDCPLGSHRLRLRTKQGLSELRTFRVGGFPQSPETEPNNDPQAAAVQAQVQAQAAGSLATARTFTGVVKGEDVDCFPVHAVAGERLAVAIDAIRLEQEMFDPAIDIVDERGFVLAACDDHPLLGQDAMLAATAPADGVYYIRVRESAFGGNDGCLYLLHVGRFPVPHVAWPPGGVAGSEIEVEWRGDPAGPFRTKVVLPAQADRDGLAEVRPQRDGVVSPVGVPLRIAAVAPVAEAEPNNEPKQAGVVAAPTGIIGLMDAADDVDWFCVEAPKGSAWRVRGWGRRLGSPIDLVVNIHRNDEKREKITGNDDTNGPDSEVKVKTPEEGSFLVRVNDHQQRGGESFGYWIDVEPAEQGVTVSVPPGRSNSQERLVAAIPRGNRTALVFNTARSDCSDPVQLAFTGLPAGVTAIAPPADEKLPGTFAVFEAAADASLATGLVTVAVNSIASKTEGSEPASPVKQLGTPRGGLRQVTELVFGPNNASYRTSVSDRLAVAIVEPVQFKINVDAPLIPLVRRGSMELRVRIERAEGFKGNVRLGFPFKPPGIGAVPSVDVAEDIFEISYPINATADAALGEWPVVVTAAAKEKDLLSGWVSSLPVMIRVAEPLVELTAEKAVTELGQEAKIVCKVTKPGSFEGVAKVKLMGLPAKTEAPELDLSPTTTELVFPVTVATDALPGRHENIFCQVRVPMAGTWVVHSMPGTHLRIDKPLPKPKPDNAAAAAGVKKEGS